MLCIVYKKVKSVLLFFLNWIVIALGCQIVVLYQITESDKLPFLDSEAIANASPFCITLVGSCL